MLAAIFGYCMRLDKYLKVSRIIKRRTLANEACTKGHVSINGKVAKASSEVNVGDTISIRFGEKVTTVRVKSISETVRKEESTHMYELIEG
jgi:ribosomal 50S subunit-recycling heat shock protein